MMQMAYMSFATLELKADPDREIAAILDEAIAENSRRGITGELIYRNGIFLQLLEGRKEEVELILGRILLDQTRHESLKVLLKQPMQERIFPDWSMAYVKLENAALDIVNSILPWQNLINASTNSPVPASAVLKIFEQLRT